MEHCFCDNNSCGRKVKGSHYFDQSGFSVYKKNSKIFLVRNGLMSSWSYLFSECQESRICQNPYLPAMRTLLLQHMHDLLVFFGQVYQQSPVQRLSQISAGQTLRMSIYQKKGSPQTIKSAMESRRLNFPCDHLMFIIRTHGHGSETILTM